MKGDGYTIMGINLPHIIIKPRQNEVGFKTDEINGVYMFHYTPDAIVVKQDSPFQTLQDLIDYAKQQLTAYKYPRSVDFVESLPKGATGKILKRELRRAGEIERGIDQRSD